MDAPTRTALLIQICLLTNKWLIPTRSSIIQDVAQQALDHLKHSAVPSELKETAHNSLRILFWLTKAVILAVDASSTHLLDHLLSLLAYPHYGLPTARGFSLLLAPHDLLTRDNSINSKRIHAQRVFYHCMPKLASDFRQATPATKPNYLIALAGLVKDVPTPAIMHHLDTFPPLLLQSMDLPDPDVKAASIETVRILLREYPDALESYISSLIPRLLLAAKFTSSSNQMVCVFFFIPPSPSLSLYYPLFLTNNGRPPPSPLLENPHHRPPSPTPLPVLLPLPRTTALAPP